MPPQQPKLFFHEKLRSRWRLKKRKSGRWRGSGADPGTVPDRTGAGTGWTGSVPDHFDDFWTESIASMHSMGSEFFAPSKKWITCTPFFSRTRKGNYIDVYDMILIRFYSVICILKPFTSAFARHYWMAIGQPSVNHQTNLQWLPNGFLTLIQCLNGPSDGSSTAVQQLSDSRWTCCQMAVSTAIQ